MSVTELPTVNQRDRDAGRIVAMLMASRGVENQALAKRIGMSPGLLSHRIKGIRPWKLAELDKVAAVFGVPSALLLQTPEHVVESLRSINYRSA